MNELEMNEVNEVNEVEENSGNGTGFGILIGAGAVLAVGAGVKLAKKGINKVRLTLKERKGSKETEVEKIDEEEIEVIDE